MTGIVARGMGPVIGVTLELSKAEFQLVLQGVGKVLSGVPGSLEFYRALNALNVD